MIAITLKDSTDLFVAIDNWLLPTSVTEHQLFLDRNHCHPHTCKWIKQNKTFQSWVEHNPSPHLWVHGLPGSGKSVLAANTINFLQENPSSICAYFFCNYGEPAKRSADSIVRTIASQVARSSEPSLTALTKLRLSHYNLTRPIPLIIPTTQAGSDLLRGRDRRRVWAVSIYWSTARSRIPADRGSFVRDRLYRRSAHLSAAP